MSPAARAGAQERRTPAAGAPLRIGEVAERAGTTARTVRYYEEIGLLPERHERAHGKHRLYDEADVERLRELIRLRDLLGVSLEELKTLVEAEEARAALRRRWERAGSESERRRILEQALGHVEAQLGVVRGRIAELGQLERELTAKRRRQRARLREIERTSL
jgi:DNA-binding transcriptional MerR regulator